MEDRWLVAFDPERVWSDPLRRFHFGVWTSGSGSGLDQVSEGKAKGDGHPDTR